MSNAWSRRRSVIKRPPVCRSKPGQEDEANWPAFFTVNGFWVQDDGGMNFNNFGASVAWARIGNGPQYVWLGANSQGDTLFGLMTMAIAPGTASIQWIVGSGFFSGELITGTFTGWPGTAMWDSGNFPLTGDQPNFTGNCTVFFP